MPRYSLKGTERKQQFYLDIVEQNDDNASKKDEDNRHLIAIDFLIRSFDIYNISTDLPPIALVSLGIEAAGAMFYTGGLIMLPVVGALLLTNIAIGVITRSSPQLNMFSFAFPVTLLLAFFVLYLSSRTIGNAFADLTKNSLESIDVLFLGK